MASRTRSRAAWTSFSVTTEPKLPAREAPRQFDAVADSQLVEDRLQVALHGLRGDGEPLGDLATAQAVGDEQGDLALPVGEAVRRGLLDHGRALHDAGQHLAPQVELRAPLADGRGLDAEPLAGVLHDERPPHPRGPVLRAVRQAAQLSGQRATL